MENFFQTASYTTERPKNSSTMRTVVAYIFVMCAILAAPLFAQDAKHFRKLAKTDYDNELYHLAAINYERVLEFDPEDQDARYHLGISYLHFFDHAKGLEALREVFEADKDIDKHIHYWLGKAYHLNYDFVSGVHHYNEYLKTLKGKDTRREKIEKLIEECGYGDEYMHVTQHYEIINAGPEVNSKYQEHSPVLTQDGSMLLFTSQHYLDSEEEVEREGEYLENIYFSEINASGEWTKPKPFPLNGDGHDATVQLFDNDTKLLMYKNTKGGDLYTSSFENGNWGDPIPLEEINSYWPEVDGYIDIVGDKMFYATSAENNGDNFDIYMAKKVDGKWADPVALPDYINTDYDENSPFVSSDGKILFFSSNGHTSMGGYDVFKCVWDESINKWGKPENLGHPINTTSDDIYFYFTNDNNWSGYFASYREGGYGGKDLYHVVFVPNVFVQGSVTYFDNGEPATNVKVEFHSDKHGGVHADDMTDMTDGRYRVNVLAHDEYAIQVLDENGKTLTTAHFEVPMLTPEDELEYVFNIKIDRESDQPQMAMAEHIDAPDGDEAAPDNMTNSDDSPFNSNSSESDSEFASRSDDSNNGRAMNDDISSNESESRELNDDFDSNDDRPVVSTYPDVSDLIDNPYGDNNSYELNDDLASESDNSGFDNTEEFATNNNSGTANESESINNETSSSNSTYSKSDVGADLSKIVAGLSKEEIDRITVRQPDGSLKLDIKKYFGLSNVQSGCKGVFRNVYFDFNKASLSSESDKELELFVCFMKDYPDMKVEIAGHTDAVGNADYNLSLSKSRANSVVNHLVKNGIAKSRLESIGYGEMIPLASNDDEDEGREYNRRIEFYIVNFDLAAN